MRRSLVLASRSPRRRSLLESVGLELSVRATDADETPRDGEAPLAYVLRVAALKSEVSKIATGEVLLAADTTVAVAGRILGKAESAAEAAEMLRALSGRTHAVHTAVVVRTESRTLSDVVTTVVRFRGLSELEIERYVASGEPMDKAGAYAVQGAGGALVDRIEGSYTNVVGLPLEETLTLLRLAGIW